MEQHNAITTTLCLLDKKDLCLDNIELMQDAVGLLASFESVTTEVSSEAYVSLSKVIPLIRSLQKLTISSTSKSQLRDKLIANIAYRFGTVENNHLLAASTFLDPRFKKIAFTQISAANDCEKRLLNEMGTITLLTVVSNVNYHLLTVDTSSQAELQTSSLEGHCNVWSFFDEKVSQCQRARTTQSHSLVEMKQYLQNNLLDRKEDPLHWWSANKSMYKRLYVLATKYLCIPATSVPSERLFSKAGELISAKRSCLKEKT